MTTCIVNGKKYIGKYEGKESDNYLGSGKLLRRAIKKYGVHNFYRTILERFSSKEDVRSAEIYYIKLFNAIDSEDFYNIAAGGEGGNTYAGITGSDRILLKEKLKSRKKANKTKYKNMVACLNLQTNKHDFLSESEFVSSYVHVGIACKGIYVTPFGNFSSSDLMGKKIGIDYTSLSIKCKRNNLIIRRAHFQSMKELTPYYQCLQNYMGQTFKEAGFGFIPIQELINKDLVYYKELNIFKIKSK